LRFSASKERAAVNAVLETSYLSIGPQIGAFEERFARYTGAAHAIGVNSGTSGLHLCIIAAGTQAFLDGDLAMAESVVEGDDRVDELYHQVDDALTFVVYPSGGESRGLLRLEGRWSQEPVGAAANTGGR